MNKFIILLAAALGADAATHTACAQGGAFTYQGRLAHAGLPATGLYDLDVGLWDAAAAGSQLGSQTLPAVPVTNGLFTVVLNFGPALFDGPARWLRLGFKTNSASIFYTYLEPRQFLPAIPYAFRAGIANTVNNGAVGNAQLAAGAVAQGNLQAGGTPGAGKVLASTSAGLIWTNAGAASASWLLGGNATAPGYFLGTLNRLNLELRADNLPALLLDTNRNVVGRPDVNFARSTDGVIAGGSGNFIGSNAVNGSIGGGLNNRVLAAADTYFGLALPTSLSVIGGGYNNVNQGVYAVIAGGIDNSISTNAGDSFIGGGYQNKIRNESFFSSIVGGWDNEIRTNSLFSVIGGGFRNVILTNSEYTSILGGCDNQGGGRFSTVAGGQRNEATGAHSFSAGYRAKARHAGALVWADGQDADFLSTAENQFLVRANGGVGINTNRPQQALHVNGGFALIEGNAHEQAYIGGDGFTSDVQIGSLNPAIARVTLYNPTADGLMSLTALEMDAVSTVRTPLVEVSQRIRVPGAGVGTTGPAFIHRATAANTVGYITTLNHPLCNGNPNAILTVTANYNPGGTGGAYNNHSLGVAYNGSGWIILNQDFAAMPVNAAFNVLVINP